MTDHLTILDGKKTLYWKKYLEDENFQADVVRFQEAGTQGYEDSIYINKDIPRTRYNDPFFQNPDNQELFKKMAIAYCAVNNLQYTSGFLELMAPFFFLNSAGLPLEHCYAYFASFIRKYYPCKFLASSDYSMDQREKSLEDYYLKIDYLIAYHSPKTANTLQNVTISSKMFACGWIITCFCLKMNLELVYEIFDQLLHQEDPYFLAYLVAATIIIKDDDLQERAGDEMHDLFWYIMQNLQNEVFHDLESVSKVLHLARQLKEQTPRTFEDSLLQFFTKENVPIISKTNHLLEVCPSEIINFWLRKGAFKSENQPVSQIGLEFQILDCRSVLGRSDLPYSISLSRFKENKKTNVILERICNEFSGSHICLLQSNDEGNEQERVNIQNLIIALRDLNRSHISFIKGGFEGILTEMRLRNMNTATIENKKVSFFKRLASCFPR